MELLSRLVQWVPLCLFWGGIYFNVRLFPRVILLPLESRRMYLAEKFENSQPLDCYSKEHV